MGTDLLKSLNPDQRKVVEQTDGPVLVLAGAGSGKTRCITYRVAYLIEEKKINPERVLLLTFTNKAAAEMKERVEKLVGVTPAHAGTFHSLCAKILRKDGKHIGIHVSYVIYDEADQVAAVKQAMKRLDISIRDFKPRSVLATISAAKNELIAALEYPQYAKGNWQTTVARIYLEYTRVMLKARALDFDDLLMKTVELFHKHPKVLAKYQDQWQYILVDEYQDTNHAQFVLTKLLSKKWRNICCVGDFSQSVYRWRGADFGNLERLKQEFPDMKTFSLEQNYRSTQNILDAAHGVISRNTTHPVLSLWTDKKAGDKIGIYEALNERDEGKFIVNTVTKSGGQYTDFAVLYRTNAQSRAIEEALIQSGIAYMLVGGTRFYQRREIKDLLAYMRVVANKEDNVSKERIEKLGKRRLHKFEQWAKQLNRDVLRLSCSAGRTPFEITQDKQDDTAALKSLAAESKKKSPGITTVELLDAILEVTNYLDKFDDKDEEDRGRLENIKELRSVAAEFSNLTDFLENVALVENDFLPGNSQANMDIDEETGKGRVTLMTLHAAKGLEFPTVFLIGMEEGLFPHSRSMLEKDALEEERRLAYVGMTRAKEKLFISYARRRLYFGTRNSNMVSRFIGEIPEELLEPVTRNSFDFDLD